MYLQEGNRDPNPVPFSVASTRRPLHVTCADRVFEIEILDRRLIIDGRELAWSAVEADRDTISLLLDGRSYDVHIERNGLAVYAVTVDQHTWRVQVGNDYTKQSSGTDLQGDPFVLMAPMPGMVRHVMVQPGDTIEAGQGLVVLEAMKMENELCGAGPGRVRAVHIEPGQAVTRGALLMEFDV